MRVRSEAPLLQFLHSSFLFLKMSSLHTSAALLKPFADLAAGEKPLLAVRIVPSAAVAGVGERRPFHLALLIDVSGSMDGERITAVRTTLQLLVEALQDDDVLTLISYQSTANVVAQGAVITETNRGNLVTAVNNLTANGGTNLEAAILALHRITHPTTSCHDLPPPAPVDAVFLLTDGFINQGLTSPAALLSMLMAAVPEGTPVHTLGYGADHNARMLRDMSMQTRASYTYADASELLPSIVGDILAGLATEVGRCGRLTIETTGWRCLELGAAIGSYNVGTLIDGKDQWIVLEGPEGATEPPSLVFSWKTSVTAPFSNTVVTVDPDSMTSVTVAEQVARVRVAAALSAATDAIEAGSVASTVTALEALRTELQSSSAAGTLFVVQLLAQVEEMLVTLRRAAAAPPTLHRVLGFGGAVGGGCAAAPSLAPIVTRMASNTVALSCQRGYVSMVSSQAPEEEEPFEPTGLASPTAHPSDAAGVTGGGMATPRSEAPAVTGGGSATPASRTYSFASPTQRTMTQDMRNRYTQSRH